MNAVVSFRPKKLRRDERELLRTRPLVDLLDDPFLSEPLRRIASELDAEIDRSTASNSGWPFIMLSPSQHRAVVRFLRTVRRSQVAQEVWAVCFEHVHPKTGEILLSRDQIAAEVGASADDVSRIMSQLADFGAVLRERVVVAGMRGPGVVRYRMNPNVATHVASSVARDAVQAGAPKLKLVDGGLPSGERRSRTRSFVVPVL
jgi:hypothetical protein